MAGIAPMPSSGIKKPSKRNGRDGLQHTGKTQYCASPALFAGNKNAQWQPNKYRNEQGDERKPDMGDGLLPQFARLLRHKLPQALLILPYRLLFL